MSWEGYGQALCENGHAYTVDGYGGGGEPCLVCGAPQAWVHWVDQTNGCYCEEGEDKCPAHPLILEEKTPAKTKTCPLCQHTEQIEPATYFIPSDKGK